MHEKIVAALYDELDEWNFMGEEATFWWRDDDAQVASSKLDRLLVLSDEFSIPVSLAVIPEGLGSSLIDKVSQCANVSILQHGFSHRNHAGSAEKKQELGAHRPLEEILGELGKGKAMLGDGFAEQFCPVMVPPWNRIDAALFDGLSSIGYMGVSTFKPRSSAVVSENIWMVNTHADIIDWKADKQFIGEEVAIGQ